MERTWLVRDFIHDHLYAGQGEGYFSSGEVIGRVGDAGPIDFGSLRGEDDFRDAVAGRYRATSRWMTPVEVFAPFYSYAIADRIASVYSSKAGQGDVADNADRAEGGKRKLHIVEVGGGTGSNAIHALDRLRDSYPLLYEICDYAVLEISEGLAHRQREAIRLAGHASKARVILGSALDLAALRTRERESLSINSSSSSSSSSNDDVATEGGRGNTEKAKPMSDSKQKSSDQWLPPIDSDVFVVALEVLDNLPHDRCVSHPGGGPLLETHIVLHNNGSLSEIQVPATDQDLIEAYDAVAPWSNEDLEYVRENPDLASVG